MTRTQGDPATQPATRVARTLALVVLLVVGAAVAFWGWQGGGSGGDSSDSSDVALFTVPPVSVTEPLDPTDAQPETREAGRTADDDRAPTVTPPPRTAPTATPTTEATEAAQPAPTAVGGAPVHLSITHGAEVLVDAPVALTQLNERDELNPPPGVVGWYGPPQWQTVPGELSSYPGVLAGHTTYDGAGDVFSRLGEVMAGDRVTIRYADGQEAVFVTDADALSVPKNEVTEKAGTDYAWVWSLPQPGQKVSLFSCDVAQGRDLTGHSLNNWVVQATRTG